MKVCIFGGSFDPVHSQHVAMVRAAVDYLHLDRVIVLPSYLAPHKKRGAFLSGEDRLACVKLAFRDMPAVEGSDYELRERGTSFTYLTVRHFKELYPEAELFLLMGADMLDNFFFWKNPQDILSNATIVACGRGKEGTDCLREKFLSEFGKDFISIPFAGKDVSSTKIRLDLAFGRGNPDLDGEVARYLRERGAYGYPCIGKALSLEKPERREHTYRVALMAMKGARKFGIAEDKALLAAALHDCAKYLDLSSPYLKGFVSPENVPAPVLHQYTGAYVAEHSFGIADEEILNAIRYHTSGRENMSPLEKLVFLADMLEEGRDFPHVEELRQLFYKDLDECLYESLKHQVEYLYETGKPVYPLTERAFSYMKDSLGK